MTRWTGGRFVAPVHRVVNPQQQQQKQQPEPSPSPSPSHSPSGEASAARGRLSAAAAFFRKQPPGQARQCLAFFMHANHDAVVYDVTAAHPHSVRIYSRTSHNTSLAKCCFRGYVV